MTDTTLRPRTYRGWEIYPSDAPIPGHDWVFMHASFDGAPDAGDNRCGHAATLAEARAEIDAREDDGA